ncbi:MAG: hypothetical protein K9K62_06720, partial [Desulfobacteraceae bacterium]|nr:hypothetical protein [Desulfobacteraceae bacterium]
FRAEIEARRGSWSEETPFSQRRSAKVLADFLSVKIPPWRDKQLFTNSSRCRKEKTLYRKLARK